MYRRLLQGKAIIVASGTITSGCLTTEVQLAPSRCAACLRFDDRRVVADSSVPTGETPGLMMALDHGAIETSFATGRDSDMLMTP